MKDSFGARSTLEVGGRRYEIFRLGALAGQGYDVSRLPYSLRILLEALLRAEDGTTVTRADIEALAGWKPAAAGCRGEPGDRVHAGPRHPAGLHRGSGGGRSRRDARCHGGAGRRSAADQPAPAGRARDRPLGAGRCIRQPAGIRRQRRARLRAERGAVCFPPLGPAGVRQLPRRAAQHRHRAPGQPGVLGAGCDDVGRAGGAAEGCGRAGISRHRRRHRFPYSYDQRPRGPGLGRRRHRGRGGDVGAAGVDADSRP